MQHHFDDYFVRMMEIGPEVPSRPFLELRLIPFRNPSYRPEYVPIELQHLLPQHKLKGVQVI